jgi:hypothetical protein
MLNYVTAFAALGFGYKNEESMESWRLRTVRGLQRLLGRPVQ